MASKMAFKLDLTDKKAADMLAGEVLKRMKSGMTVQQAMGVSDETLEEIYSLAYGYYNQGKYKEAIALFQFLSGAAPTVYKYVLGLASSFHQLESYIDAACGFYIALNIEPDNPLPAYYITDCFLKQDLREEAEEFAKFTVKLCGNKAKYQELKERCELIHKSLKK